MTRQPKERGRKDLIKRYLHRNKEERRAEKCDDTDSTLKGESIALSTIRGESSCFNNRLESDMISVG